MKLTEDQANEIINIQDISTAVRLLKAYALEEKGLQKTIQKVTYGIKIPFHYQRWEQGLYNARIKAGTVKIHNKVYKLEELWEEVDDRISLAQQTLLTLLTEPSKYKAR